VLLLLVMLLCGVAAGVATVGVQLNVRGVWFVVCEFVC